TGIVLDGHDARLGLARCGERHRVAARIDKRAASAESAEASASSASTASGSFRARFARRAAARFRRLERLVLAAARPTAAAAPTPPPASGASPAAASGPSTSAATTPSAAAGDRYRRIHPHIPRQTIRARLAPRIDRADLLPARILDRDLHRSRRLQVIIEQQ